MKSGIVVIFSEERLKQNQPDDSYGFFLYFYDEARGHIPLFSHPSDLLLNEDAKRIIKIHPIWWHQETFIDSEKFEHIDLEMEGINYSATLLQCKSRRTKRRSGMESSRLMMERFILIIRSPASVSFIAQEILHELRMRITGELGERLCYLIEKNLQHDDKYSIDEETTKNASQVESDLINLCTSLIPQMPLAKLNLDLNSSVERITASNAVKHPIEEIPKKRRFTIPKLKKESSSVKKPEIDLRKKPKRVKILEIKEESPFIEVTAKNSSSNLINNAVLRIYESQGFFGHDLKVFRRVRWEPEEQITLKFEIKPDPNVIYFLKIEDDQGTIKVRRILG